MLIDHKANVNVKDGMGGTPLEIVAWSNNIPIMEMLLASKADVNVKNMSSMTPLHGAAANGSKEAAKIGGPWANVNARAIDKKTPLHHAAEKGSKEIVELLLAHGADPNVKEAFGETPLIIAAFKATRMW